jgi:hypothetical protein
VLLRRGIRGATITHRLIAGVAILLCLATASVFAWHHHTSESDTFPCLICAAARSPASETGCASLLVVDSVATAPLFLEFDLHIACELLRAAEVRAPPSC